MSSNAKKIAIAAIVAAALGLGAFLYATRPIAPPSDSTPQVATPNVDIVQGQKAYRVDAAASKVTFSLNEVLSGSPFLVVGETNQVSADIALDLTKPSASKIGIIKIDARGFKTDSTRRDGMIGRFILKSEDPATEFIVFAPKTLEGMPSAISAGKSFTFKVKGDLTIAGVTKEATFDGTATLGADGTLTGDAASSVQRADYNLVIPNVPFVASVDQQVKVKIQFVAKPVTG